MPNSVFDYTNITSQTGGRQITKKFDDANTDLFRGILQLDHGRLNQYDFMVGGYGMFFWINLPTFMQAGNPDLAARFKNLTEKGATSFDGIQDMQVSTEDVTGGIAGNSFKQVTNMKDEFDTFTIKVYELQGSPYREAIEYWLTGIRDPKSGWATYHGLLQKGVDNGGLEYSAANHSGELIYIATDPSGMKVEYACVVANVIPTKVPKSHLDLTHGEHQMVQMDLEFTGVKYESNWIMEIAQKILEAQLTIRHYMSFTPAESGQKMYNDLTKTTTRRL